MNTATWASMEADSGGEVAEPYSLAWMHIIHAAVYYDLCAQGYTNVVAAHYSPFFAQLIIVSSQSHAR